MNTRDVVRQFISENFFVGPQSALTDDGSLMLLGIVDSTGMLELTAFLEKTFDLDIGDLDITPENLDTIERIVVFVERKTSACGAA
jgi:acyl carrier protein